MKTQFTDSDLRCPYDGKKLIVELGERGDGTDAGYEAVHRCWNCDYTEVETGRTVPLASTTGPILAHLRDRIRDDAMTTPVDFQWPEVQA